MRDSNIKIPIIVALVVAVVSLGVAFAAFSTQLNINGTATVQASSWDIYFTTAASGGSKPESSTNMPSGTITPSGSVSDATASILATTFTWSANFKSPNDKVVYTIYVKNGGDYNAKVSNISMPTITCTSDTKSACGHLHYGLFTDSTGVTPLSTAFQVNAGATETFYLVAYLDNTYGGNDGSELVSTDLTTDSISATVTFEQVGGATSGQSQQGGGSSSGGGQAASVQYLTGNYEWVNSLSDVVGNNVTPMTYIKKQNDDILICYNKNSTEQCFDEDDFDDPEAVVSSSCNGEGFSFESDIGCGSGNGTMCYGPDISIFGFHSIYDINWEYADGEPYLSKGFEIYANDSNEWCSLSTEYSEDTGSYELLYSCSYNVETGD